MDLLSSLPLELQFSIVSLLANFSLRRQQYSGPIRQDHPLLALALTSKSWLGTVESQCKIELKHVCQLQVPDNYRIALVRHFYDHCHKCEGAGSNVQNGPNNQLAVCLQCDSTACIQKATCIFSVHLFLYLMNQYVEGMSLD